MEDQVVKKPLPAWVDDDDYNFGGWGKKEEPKPLPCEGLETAPEWLAQRVQKFDENISEVLRWGVKRYTEPMRENLREVCGKDCVLAELMRKMEYFPHNNNETGQVRDGIRKCLPNLKRQPAPASYKDARGAVPRPAGAPLAEDAIRKGRD